MNTPALRTCMEAIGTDLVSTDRTGSDYLKRFVSSEITKWALPIRRAASRSIDLGRTAAQIYLVSADWANISGSQNERADHGVDSCASPAGGQVGCDLQLSPQWLIGINGDADWANISGSQTETLQTMVLIPVPTPVTLQGTLSAKTNFLATATVRGGFVVGPGLFYAKGGVAWDKNQYNFIGTATIGANSATLNFTGSDNRIGWTVGVGTEWAISPHFSFNAEYDFIDFGSNSVNFTSASLPSTSINATQHVNELKAGFNFRP
jgi:opacity protein-like surface antigen